MVKLKYVGVVAVLAFLCGEANAGLPTFDGADVAGTTNIVKSGVDNMKSVQAVTSAAGKLNSVVGDATATLSKYQGMAADKINAAKEKLEKAQKIKARVEKAKQRYEKVKKEVEKRKAQYEKLRNTAQSAIKDVKADIDRVKKTVNDVKDGVEAAKDAAKTAVAAAGNAVDAAKGKINNALGKKNSEETSGDDYMPTSDDRNYDDGSDGYAEGENLDGSPADYIMPEAPSETTGSDDGNAVEMPADSAISEEGREPNVVGDENSGYLPADLQPVQIPGNNGETQRGISSRKGFTRPEQKVDDMTRSLPVSGGNAVEMPAGQAKAVQKLRRPEAVSLSDKQLQPKAAVVKEAAPSVAPVKKFRVSPQKVSSLFEFTETVAFAAEMEASPSEQPVADGNPDVGDKNVFPYALLCGGSAEDYVNDADKQKKCLDELVRKNHAKNHVDASANQKDCRKMVYQTLVAILAETTSSKAKAATYEDTLDNQKADSAKATQLRDDLAALGMSSHQMQLLLNEMSLNLSSQILLYTAQQVCQLQEEVLDEEETSSDGEK